MKVLLRGLFLFSVVQFALCGFVQAGKRTPPKGPIQTEKRAQAIDQPIGNPQGIAMDGAGGFYVSSAHQGKIYRVAEDGTIRLIAGNGLKNYGGDGGPASVAQLSAPTGLAVDAAGNLYIADQGNHRIRKITPAGIITTVAGNGTQGSSGDGGPAIDAQLAFPYGVAVDAAKNLYITDSGNHRIRKVTPAGIITTLAEIAMTETGADERGEVHERRGITNSFLANVAVDSAGNVYVADNAFDRIRKITPAGIISVAAGDALYLMGGDSGDGGPATAARLNHPCGIAVDAAGNLYVADTYNNRIRKVTPQGIITNVAGSGIQGYGGDGAKATAAQFKIPVNVAVDSAGNFYISDSANDRVRKVTPAGMITTVAGNGHSGPNSEGVSW